MKQYGARFLVRAGRFENPEGGSRARNAVIEFPSYQAALEGLLVATPHPMAVEVERSITLMQQKIAANQVVAIPDGVRWRAPRVSQLESRDRVVRKQ